MRPFLSYPEGRVRGALAEDHRLAPGEADLRARQLVPARPRRRPLPLARIPGQPAPAAVAAAAEERRGQGAADAGRHPPHPRRARPGGGGGRAPAISDVLLSIDVDRWRQEMTLPRGAPQPVPRPARRGMGSAQARRRATRGGVGRPLNSGPGFQAVRPASRASQGRQQLHQTSLMYCPGHGDAGVPSPRCRRRRSCGWPGDPLRWRLLSELARSDRRVGELTALVGQPQNLVSYHLGRLRAAGWCRCGAARPTAATATTASIWPAAASCWPRPARRCTPAWAALHRPPPGGHRATVRCGCCSCAPATAPARRSPRRCVAAGRRWAGRGGQRGQPPQAAAPERGAGDARARHRHRRPRARSTSTSSPGSRFDYVITLCDKVREVCPEFPGHPDVDPLEHPRPRRRRRHRRASYPAFQRRRRPARPASGSCSPAIDHRQPLRKETAMTGIDENVVNVRYLVDDVQPPSTSTPATSASPCATAHLPAFADVTRGNLRLLLPGRRAPPGRPMPDGRRPGPGGWNRIHLIVDDLAAEVARLRAAGVAVPQRHRHRPRRPAGPARRPRREPDRTVHSRRRPLTDAARAATGRDRRGSEVCARARRRAGRSRRQPGTPASRGPWTSLRRYASTSRSITASSRASTCCRAGSSSCQATISRAPCSNGMVAT